MKKNRNTVTDIFLLILITVIAYFPVSAFLFSLENDSLVQYLPYRYHVSESIQHGYFPFWNPYLYTGFPVHADMQGMTWNPVVLIISLFTRYNMSVLEFEVVIYLALAAIGMYSLLKSFSLARVICILGGISYMSCGFINGSASVIPWISSAAFIPFVFLCLKKFLEQSTLKNSFLFSISLSLLFLCGYPTFFIFTSYIIFAVLLFAAIIRFKDKPSTVDLKTAGLLAIGVVTFLFICSPAIISYWEFLPYYSRGGGISVAKAAENPFTPYSTLSFILPNAVHKEHVWLNTDPSMRNSYVGLFVFCLFCFSLIFKRDKWQNLFLGITAFSFLLTLGSVTPLHKICYSILPLFSTFRHPGNIRLFSSIGIILLAAIFVQQLLQQNRKELRKKLVSICYVTTAILFLPVIYSLLFQNGVINNIMEAAKSPQPKVFLDSLRFPSMLLIQAILQLLFVAAMIYQLKKETWNKKTIAVLIAANSILFCWLSLPYTVISQVRTKAVNQYVAAFPDGYPLPDINASVEANVISDSISIPVYGYPNFYSKKITIQDHIINPTLNKDYEVFNANLRLRALMQDYPFVWLNDTIVSDIPDTLPAGKKFSVYTSKEPFDNIGPAEGAIAVKRFTPNHFVFSIRSENPGVLSIFQQYNQNWKVKLNGTGSQVLQLNIAFMGVRVPAGENIVEFAYKPAKVCIAILLAVVTILFIALFFMVRMFKRVRQ